MRHYNGDPENKASTPDFGCTIQHATADMITMKMPNSWSDVALAWFAILEAQLRIHKIIRQSLRFEISAQWMTVEIAISISDVLFEPMSDALYNAICII